MSTINVTNFRNNIFEYLTQTIKYNQPLNISTKDGNAVVLSEDDYLGLMETLYLISKTGMAENLIAGKNTDIADCVSADEVDW